MKTKTRRSLDAYALRWGCLLAGGLAVSLWLGGCAAGGGMHSDSSRVDAGDPPRRRSAWVSDQGRSWEVVFAPPGRGGAGAYGGEAQGGWEVARNDYQVAARTDTYVSAATDWPEAERPSLDRARWLTLPRDANRIIYYQTESEYRSSGYGYGWGGGGWWY